MPIDLEETYKQLKEEFPLPFEGRCTGCKTKMITQLEVSFVPEKNSRIKLLRPANCPECIKQDGLLVTVVGEIAANGKIYPKNRTERPR